MGTSLLIRSSLAFLSLTLCFDLRAETEESKKNDGIPTRSLVNTNAISLADLIDKSEVIFYGEVVSVNEKMLDATSTPVKVVHFKNLEAYKGKPESTYTMSPIVDVPIHNGDKVLWYLPKVSRLGVVAPLGIHSGYFRIQQSKGKSPIAMNLKHNDGLWGKGPDDSLFNVIDQKLIHEMAAANKFETPWDIIHQEATAPNTARPLPLALLVAATKGRLQANK